MYGKINANDDEYQTDSNEITTHEEEVYTQSSDWLAADDLQKEYLQKNISKMADS